MGVNASLSESSRQASRISRDVLSKAVSKVENRVREERVRRTLTRSVARTRHVINNDADEHVRGVYRWVDRVDRYQIFRYPDRLHLEFQIPEPAEYLRLRIARPKPTPPGGVDKPPNFVVSPHISPATGTPSSRLASAQPAFRRRPTLRSASPPPRASPRPVKSRS